MADGRLTEEEAKEQFYAAADELGLLDETGVVVILPVPEPDKVSRPPMPVDYEPTPEEEELVALILELAILIEEGEISEDEAWDQLVERAEELGWSDLSADGRGSADVEIPGGEEPSDGGSTGPEPAADDGPLLLTLQTALTDQVRDDDLSSGDAWSELTQAVREATEEERTAIEQTSWGAIKAVMHR